MNKIRVCHMADFHLGGRGLSEDINNNLIRSFGEIFKMLNSSKVDLVLIAGDFYETSSVDNNLLRDIKETFEKFSGQIVISPGNHDYNSVESVYRGDWPANVHIFDKEEVSYFEFGDISTRVYGGAFGHSHIYDGLVKRIAQMHLDPSYINLGLFHGQVDERANAYNPISIKDIESSGLDYLALGHVHKRTPIQKAGGTYWAYSGNPVSRGFDELGEKGIYLGDISKGKNSLNFYKLDFSTFNIVDLDLEAFESQTQVAGLIRKKLEEDFGPKYKNNYYRLILNGYTPGDFKLNFELIGQALDDIKHVEFIDKTFIEVDLDLVKDENSLKGLFVKNALALDVEDSLKDKIIDQGIRAFEDLL